MQRQQIAALFTLLIGVCFASASAQVPWDDQPEPQPLSKTSGLLRISFDDHSSLQDFSLLKRIIESPRVRAAAVEKVAKDAKPAIASPDPAKVMARVISRGETTVASLGKTLVTVVVSSFDERLPAEAVFKALVPAIKERIGELAIAERAGEQELAERLAQEAEELSHQLKARQTDFEKLANQLNVPFEHEQVAQMTARLDAQQESLETDMHGLEARVGALRVQIAKQGDEAKTNRDAATLRALEMGVTTQNSILQQLVRANEAAVSAVPKVEILKAQRDLAEREAELSRFVRGDTQSPAAQRVEELKRQLDDATIDLAERQAKLEFVQELKARLRKAAGLQLQHRDLQLLEREYRMAHVQASELRNKLRAFQYPVVTQID